MIRLKFIYPYLLGILLASNSYAQNYFQEYPINATIAINGSLNRIECSTYDSVLQTTVFYYGQWTTSSLVITSNNFGKVGFIGWVSPGVQDSVCGFIIYDFNLHQFIVQFKTFTPSLNQSANVACGQNWVVIVVERNNGGYYLPTYHFYRYNMYLHKWANFSHTDYDETSSIVWNLQPNPLGNSDVIVYIDLSDELDLYYYDPVSDEVNVVTSGCAGWGFSRWEDYIAMDTGCLDNYAHLTYDAGSHGFSLHPRRYLLGNQHKGVFSAADQDDYKRRFFFTYDEAISQWLTDSIYSANLNSLRIKDRVVAYLDSIPGNGEKIYYLVHDPIQHSWIKDSTATNGSASNVNIQNGTVSWTDAGGTHVRGYDVNQGWGNYNTPLFLYFHLIDYSTQGQPMIHVRNYSIGTEKVFYDFGDGVQSMNNRHVMWHSYRDSGSYNVCIYDSSGSQMWCQPVQINLCSVAGLLSVNNDTICQGDIVQLSLLTYNGTIQWQFNDGSGWTDETAPGFNTPTITVYPTMSTRYRVKVTNGSCIPAMSEERKIFVYQNFLNTFIADTAIHSCQGQTITLVLKNAPTTANYQWQQFNGSAWIPAAGQNASSVYYSNLATSTSFRCTMSNGTCFADTSSTTTVGVNPVPPIPLITPDYTCGPGIVNLSATSSGSVNWYLPASPDSIINTGNSFSPFINNTTNFTVQSTTGVAAFAGYQDQGIGNITIDSVSNKAVRFTSDETALLESVYIYPAGNGWIALSLYNATTGFYVAQRSIQVIAGSGKTKISLNWNLLANITYDIRIAYSGASLEVNTNGISYPLNIPGSPVTITGYVDSAFQATPDYYPLYDWRLQTGCRSTTSTVQGIVETPITNAAIVPAGPTTFCQGGSVLLNSTPNGNFSYQWQKNGMIIPGADSSSFLAVLPGNYQVTLNSIVCSGSSNPLIVTVPCIIRNNNQQKNESFSEHETNLPFSVYHNRLSNQLEWTATLPSEGNYIFSIVDKSGKIISEQQQFFESGVNNSSVDVTKFTSGIYIVKLYGKNYFRVSKFIRF
jgi:hypothetical protein